MEHALRRLTAMKSRWITLLGLGFALGQIALANNLIVNGSFEEPMIGSTPDDDGEFLGQFPISTLIPGWSVASGYASPDLIREEPTTSYYVVDGRQYVELNGSPGKSRIYQTVTITSGQGGLYRLKFLMSGSWHPGDASNDRTMLVEILDSSNNPVLSQTATHPAASGYTWTPFSYDITLAPGTYIVAFESTTSSPAYSDWGLAEDSVGARLDGVSLELVPEPMSSMILGSGLAGLLAVRKRRRCSLKRQ